MLCCISGPSLKYPEATDDFTPITSPMVIYAQMLTSQNMNILVVTVVTKLSVFGSWLLPSVSRNTDGGSEPMRKEKACLCEPVTV